MEDMRADVRIILKWILRNWTGLIWLRTGTGGGSF